MKRYHELEDLAPRDVVSRAIVSEIAREGSEHMFLDLTHLDCQFVQRRFPRIYETCKRHGIDLCRQPAPIHPAAHYSMGGVRTDLDGQTNLERLFAAGEVACTGVHGANRLASNSLLEGLVYGARAARKMTDWAGEPLLNGTLPGRAGFPGLDQEEVRGIAWRHCGILRTAEGLNQALQELDVSPQDAPGERRRCLYELRSIHLVASLVARCALARQESRGGHFRTDFPASRDEFRKHSLLRSENEVTFVD